LKNQELFSFSKHIPITSLAKCFQGKQIPLFHSLIIIKLPINFPLKTAQIIDQQTAIKSTSQNTSFSLIKQGKNKGHERNATSQTAKSASGYRPHIKNIKKI